MDTCPSLFCANISSSLRGTVTVPRWQLIYDYVLAPRCGRVPGSWYVRPRVGACGVADRHYLLLVVAGHARCRRVARGGLTPIPTPTGRENMRLPVNIRADFDHRIRGLRLHATPEFESPSADLPHPRSRRGATALSSRDAAAPMRSPKWFAPMSISAVAIRNDAPPTTTRRRPR
jgi:hypothetical protein